MPAPNSSASPFSASSTPLTPSLAASLISSPPVFCVAGAATGAVGRRPDVGETQPLFEVFLVLSAPAPWVWAQVRVPLFLGRRSLLEERF